MLTSSYLGSAADGELSFAKGDVIKIINKDESGWWKGELNGKIGFLPHNFVVPIVPTATTAPVQDKKPVTTTARQPTTPTASGPTSATAQAKSLKGKATTTTTPAPTLTVTPAVSPAVAAAATPAVVTPDPRVAVLEGQLQSLRAESETNKQELQRQLEQMERKLEDAERKLEDATQRADEAELRRDKATQDHDALATELVQWSTDGCEMWDLNQLRDHKHRLKASLKVVQTALDDLKACPACETAVKDCILVPCLHAFCHKCGEKNKKQVKCSVCGLPPERIYLLSGKK
jgi:hypothetical protein